MFIYLNPACVYNKLMTVYDWEHVDLCIQWWTGLVSNVQVPLSCVKSDSVFSAVAVNVRNIKPSTNSAKS